MQKIAVEGKLRQFIKEYCDGRGSLQLLLFLGRHPHARFSQLAIVHALDARTADIEKSLLHLLDKGLVVTWTTENSLPFYSLTEDESMSDLPKILDSKNLEVEILDQIVTANFINFLIDLSILLLVMFFLGKGISMLWLYIPFLVIIEFILTCGLAVILAGIYVIFRDLSFMVNLSLKLFFYFIPVIYSIEFVPLDLRFVYKLNPLAIVIDGFAKVLFYGITPDFHWLMVAFLESAIIFILSFSIFQRIKRFIPERL